MEILFIQYPKCSTCQKAKKWLESNNIDFIDRHIIEETPTKEELKKWLKSSNYEINKFFNTSGLVYKSLNLKEKLNTMSEDKKLKLLSNNGMLIKRPILVSKDFVLIGFKEKEWKERI